MSQEKLSQEELFKQIVDHMRFWEDKQIEQILGENSDIAASKRREWCSIDSLMKELAIESDFSLPEWNLAIEIAQEIKMVKQFEADDFARRDIGYLL